MSRRTDTKTDTESILARIQQQQHDKKELERRISKDFKRNNKPSKTYATSFLHSQLRNKSFDNAKMDIEDTPVHRKTD